MDMRPPPAPATRGLLDALRAIGGTLNEVVRVRGALFAVELAEEVERRKRLLVLAAICAVFLHMALVLVSVLVAAVFWDTHRLAALGAMAILYLAFGYAALVRLHDESADSPPPFAATLAELNQDLSGLRSPQ
jgi:uncharacterized membrane protein YqjE